jgi:hypothetical protein
MKHGFTAMMNYDDRFDFPKFELPNVWLSLTNGATGAFRSGGKMKLPPGHSLAGKFPEKVASAAEMDEREAKLKGKEGAGGGDDDTPINYVAREKFKNTALLDSDTVSGAGKPTISKENLDAVGGVLMPPIVERTGVDSYRVLDGANAFASTNARGDSMTRALVTDAQGAKSLLEQRQAFKSLKPKFENSSTPMKVDRDRLRSAKKLEPEVLDLDTISGGARPSTKLARAIAQSDTQSVIPILKQTGIGKYEVVYGKEFVASYDQARKLNPNLPDRMRTWVAKSDAQLEAMRQQVNQL